MTDHCLTPPLVGKWLGCKPERVIALIRSGRLKAINLGQRSRPQWHVTPQALADFVATEERKNMPAEKTPRRRSTRPIKFIK